MPGVEFTWLLEFECTQISHRFRSFLKAAKGLSQKVMLTAALFSGICQMDQRTEPKNIQLMGDKQPHILKACHFSTCFILQLSKI